MIFTLIPDCPHNPVWSHDNEVSGDRKMVACHEKAVLFGFPADIDHTTEVQVQVEAEPFPGSTLIEIRIDEDEDEPDERLLVGDEALWEDGLDFYSGMRTLLMEGIGVEFDWNADVTAYFKILPSGE